MTAYIVQVTGGDAGYGSTFITQSICGWNYIICIYADHELIAQVISKKFREEY